MIYLKTKTLEYVSSIMVAASILALTLLSYAYYFHY